MANAKVAGSMQLQLRLVSTDLQTALSTITVAAYALREQNADIDADVAAVLQKNAGYALHAGIEKIERLIGALEH